MAGVIVITTKKGRYGEDAVVTVRANAGWSSQANDKIDMMSSEEFVRFRDLVNTPVSNEVRDFVNKYGINPDRLSIQAEGSNVQPYDVNNWNRIVIFTD